MVQDPQAIFDELGGKPVFGRVFRTHSDLESAIERGFPRGTVDEVMRGSGLTLAEIATILDPSPRSLQRRSHQGRLAMFESDRLYRLARMIAWAKQCIRDGDAAIRWSKRPNRALGGKTPLAAIATEPGARMVENVLGRIVYGSVS